MSQNTEGLRRELEALSERVERLEEARDEPARRDTRAADEDEGQFWALTGLRSRLADHPDTRSGAVMILGSLTLPDGSPVAWQQSGSWRSIGRIMRRRSVLSGIR
jgi:hypothetical protein